MADQADTEHLPISKVTPQEAVALFAAATPRTKPSHLSRFLGYLAFEGLGARIGIELSMSVVLYTLALTAGPWETLGTKEEWRGLLCWFGASIFVMWLDHLLFSHPATTFKLVCQLDCRGAYEAALRLLNQLSPYSEVTVPCPIWIFHLKRGEILSHLGRPDLSEAELEAARDSGAPPLQLALAAIGMLRSSGCFDKAATELESARNIHGDSPLLTLEEAMLVFDQHSDPRRARKLFEAVLSEPNRLHYSGETTRVIARSFLDATRLWTGEAEEALAGLSDAIKSVEATALIIESLNPLLASLMLERSFYLATHQEPHPAVLDLKRAVALCAHPTVQKRALEVKDELEWRYKLKT